MLAASLGLKLFDITRRILMYTKETDDYKHIYAVLRGTYPIHELCGTMTIILLARRDVLGVNLSMWKILGPAVFIHAMANFRGMKVSNVGSYYILSICCSPGVIYHNNVAQTYSSSTLADLQVECIFSMV